MKEYLLAHDLGTSGDKATLFTTEGELVDSEIESYPVHYYNGNWAEQDAEDWWNAFCASTRKLLARTDIQPERSGSQLQRSDDGLPVCGQGRKTASSIHYLGRSESAAGSGGNRKSNQSVGILSDNGTSEYGVLRHPEADVGEKA